MLDKIIKDKSRIFTAEEIPIEYLQDDYVGRSAGAHAVALPTTHEEVVALVQYANEKDLSIIAKGANTGLSGATAPIMGNELIIDLHLMDQIIGLDTKTLTLTVQPGVTLERIQEYVESRGFFYPPDPGSKTSSIGGNVATNAGGMRAVKYGVTRNYVRALQVVLADGQTTQLGSINIKDSSGYDLKDLFIGSEGTLGITTLIHLKVIPLPPYKTSYLVSFENLIDSTVCVNAILQSGIDPTAVEFFEKDMAALSENQINKKLPTQKGQSYLLITLDGNSHDDINRRAEVLANIVRNYNALEYIVLDTTEKEQTAWSIRDNLLKAVVSYSQQVTMDETVPIHHVSTIYEYTKELEAKYGLRMMSFGHAGDGNLHTCILRGDIVDDAVWEEKLAEVLDLFYKKIMELGGLPSAEHGIGVIKKPYFLKYMNPVNIEMIRSIKKALDPNNRMNPGKLI